MANPLFYAKILLFGEYGLIENSQGLTLPYSYYQGTLKFADTFDNFQTESNVNLSKFADYLMSISFPEGYGIDVQLLKSDINSGLYFDSNIPQGYGIGSSGALVAAVYVRYAYTSWNPSDISKDQLKELKKVFGLMESFFHGTSSGIDPLICFMNFPILIENKDSLDKITLNEDTKSEVEKKGAIFLLDSGSSGETGPMVQIFFEKMKKEGFRNTLKNEFIRYNNACIEAFLKKDMNPFFKNLKSLSKWVYVHFRPMIPEIVFSAWKKGLDTNAYYLKLCGSGGGGYILGFTEDYEKAEKMLSGFKKEVIYRF